MLVDFGEIVDLFIENVFNFLDEDGKNKFSSVPSLAFRCTIAKIRPAIHGQFESSWSNEANRVIFEYGKFLNELSGTVS